MPIAAIDDAESRASVRSQQEAPGAVAAEAGTRVLHVKPHGLLYDQAAADPTLARLLTEVVHEWDPGVVLVGLAGSRSLGRS